MARAFRELENEGILETRGRHGTHVKGAPAIPTGSERQRRILNAASAYASVVAELAIPSDVAISHVRRALNQ